MKKIFKILFITLLSILFIYITFITVEVIRFNNNLGSKPIILIDQDKIDVSSEIVEVSKNYLGLGYTIEYDYNVVKKDNSDHIEVIIMGGEFKLFGKILISAWIQ